MINPEISTNEAKQDKLFYVVANIAIVNAAEGSCLLLKRSESEKVLGGMWAFPGGKLEHKDIINLLAATGNEPIQGIDNILGKLAMREGKEECNLDVKCRRRKHYKNKVFVRPDNVPVFMATLATTYEGGTVVLEDGTFTDSAWVTKAKLSDYDCIQGVREEAEAAIDQFSKS